MNIKELTKKCFKCKNPKCMNSCPLHLNIPEIVKLIDEDKEYEAYQKLKENNILVSLCGVICPMENQCAKDCVYNMAQNEHFPIDKIEQYLTNKYYLEDQYQFPPITKRKVVVVGSGPAGLTAAILLRMNGFETVVIEAENKIGGILSTHLPKFRFDNEILLKKFNELESGIKFIFNTKVGKDIQIDEIFDYDYQIVAIGAESPIRMIYSENVFSGHEILRKYHDDDLNIKNKKIGVLGCGNVAIDVARSLKKLGNDISIIYRRTLENAPATKHELHDAKIDGIDFKELLSLNTFENNVATFDEMGLMPKVGNERQKFYKTGNQTKENFDILVEAYGSNPVFDSFEKYQWFKLINDNSWLIQHNHMNLYFIGDCMLHPSTIAKAIQSGKEVANEIIKTENELMRLKNDLGNNPIVYGGSFNPLTIAHEEIINYIYKNITDNLIILPNGDKYALKNLVSFDKRVEMIKTVFPNILIDDYENKQEFRGTVKYLEDRNHPFFVLGGDSLKEMITWIDYENLIANNRFIVFNRESTNFDELFASNEILRMNKHNFYILNVSFSPVSSSEFKNKKNELFVSSKVLDFINKNKLY